MTPPTSSAPRPLWEVVRLWLPDYRLLGGVIMLYAGLLNLTTGHWSQAAAAFVAAALLFWLLAKKFDFHVIGPLFWYELVRLGRSGWTTWLRCGYALLLLLALWVTYENWQSSPEAVSIGEAARLAEHFLMTIIIIQNIAAIVLTSLYLSGSIVDERQQGTLDYLFTTHLYDHEIIAGKLLARLLTVGSVLLTGLPVLALIQFWGGVDIRMLVAGFATTIFTLLLVGSISIFCSTRSRTKVLPILGSHGLYWMFALGFCVPIGGYASSPFFFFTEMEGRLRAQIGLGSVFDIISSNPATVSQEVIALQMMLNFAVGQTLLAAFFLRAAVKMLREPLAEEGYPITAAQLLPEQHRRKADTARHADAADNGELSVEAHHARVGTLRPADDRPPVDEPKPKWLLSPLTQHPLWWREMWRSGNALEEIATGIGTVALVVFSFFGCMIGMVAVLQGFPFTDDSITAVNFLVRAITVLSAALACMMAAFLATSNLSRERTQRTLESLLMLPIDWWKIFAIKWLALQWRCAWAGSGLMILWLVTAFTPALAIVAVPLLLAAVMVHLAFFATLGMWLSLVCKTSMRATMVMGGILLGLALGPWLFLQGEWAPANSIVNPIMTWWTLCMTWPELLGAETRFGAREPWYALVGILVYALATVLIGALGLYRFYKEPRTK